MTNKMFRMFILVLCLFWVQSTFAADFQVNQLGDAGDGTCDATCTLRDAVTAANSVASDDSISFSFLIFNTPQTIVVSGADIVISNNGSLIIRGNGAEKLTIDGNGNGRIFTVNTGAVVSVKKLTLTNGNGVSTISTGRGGAVYNNGGTLTIEDSILRNNTAVNGGAFNTAGNGTTNIYNSMIANNTALTSSGGGGQNFGGSMLNIYNSTFYGNTSNSSTGGGGLQANGMITINNSTFVNNTANNSGNGGGIVYNGQGLVMNNTTITRNTATDLTGGFHKSTTTDNAIIRNNIIAGNTATTNMADAQGNFMSQGFNLIQNPGTTTGLIASDITGSAALLTPLGFYGGFTYTNALLNGSPALNAGDNCVINLSCTTGNPSFALNFDQRGAMRPANTTVDIGAFEASGSFTARLNEGAVGVSYLDEITPDRMGFSYTLSGTLPPGLMINTPALNINEGVNPSVFISGTPTANGIYNFSINISNGTASTTINYQIRIAPTNLSGQVLDSAGNPVSGVFVTLNDGMGGIQRTQTTIGGNYNFTNVTAGTTYTVSFNGRRYAFRSEQITIAPGSNRVDPVSTN